MTDTTHETILTELKALYYKEPRRPEDVDAREMAGVWGVTERAATNRLNQLVDKGAFVKIKTFREDGYPLTLYRKVA